MQEKQAIDVATCPVTASHETTACVPVSISPFADPGPISISTCGDPVIRGGGEPCCGVPNGRYEFTVSQKMKICIPIAFGVDVMVGETYVHNGRTEGVNDGECCVCDCSDVTDDNLMITE